MSQRPNHRRGEKRHQDNGPTWESHTPNAGANSGRVARARRWWKRAKNRALRRTGSPMPRYYPMSGRGETPKPLPEIESEDAV